VSTGFGQWMRGALRLCSLRNAVLLPAGVVLALAPLPSDPSRSAATVLLPYSPTYAHHAYGYALALARPNVNAVARDWLAAADHALLAPESVALPLTNRGELTPRAAAAGYEFAVPAGRRLQVSVEVTAAAAAGDWFVDLFRVDDGRRERIAGALPGAPSLAFALDAIDGGQYLLRVQPPIDGGGAYAVEVAATPLLAFPVEGHDARAIWSGFGAERDGGRRAHRGVDIFAARGTPALAAVDGWVTRVETTRVGGNVVWLQPLFGNLRVYYAHLEQQWVESGDFVRAGQPVGSVGNTGNAITTPPHLHFGVYVRQPGMRGGARDPAGFIR